MQFGIIKITISNHFPIFTVLATNETCTLEKIKFIFKILPENIKWDKVSSINSPDETYETSHSIFSDLHATAFPKIN